MFAWALERNAVRAGKELTAKLLADAKHYLAESDAQIVKLPVTIEPPDARLAVDGRPLEVLAARSTPPVFVAGTAEHGPPQVLSASSFELWIDPGDHVFVLSRKGKSRTVVNKTVLRGETRKLELVFDRSAEPPQGICSGTKAQRCWAVGIGVAGIATVAVGAVLGGLAVARWDEAKEVCPDPQRCPNRSGFELSDQAYRYGDFATAAFVTGGAALVGAALFWFTTPSPSAEQVGSAPFTIRVTPPLGRTYLEARVSWHF